MQNQLLQDNPLYYSWGRTDQDNPLNQLDTLNALALGPLYAPRESTPGFGAGAGATTRGSPIASKWAAQSDSLGLTSNYKPGAGEAPLVVYHGLKPGYDAAGHMFVTTSQPGAEFHGPVTAYQVRPGAKIFPDLEGGTKETGLETLRDPQYGGSSAIIHRDDLIPLPAAK